MTTKPGKQIMSTKQEIVHTDKLGNPLNVGDFVAYPHNSILKIGQIIKLNPKMVKVKSVIKKKSKRPWLDNREDSGTNKYPTDCIVVRGELVTLYVLKNT